MKERTGMTWKRKMMVLCAEQERTQQEHRSSLKGNHLCFEGKETTEQEKNMMGKNRC